MRIWGASVVAVSLAVGTPAFAQLQVDDAPAPAPAPSTAPTTPPPPAPGPAPATPPPAATPPSLDTSAGAPGTDVVKLRDGTTFVGKILEQQPGRYVVIRTADGTRELSWDQVSDVRSGAPAAPGGGSDAAASKTDSKAAAATGDSAALPSIFLSFDRLMGIGAWSVNESANGGSATTSGVQAQFFVATTSPDATPASVYHTPRLALDGALGSFTLGGSLGVFFANSNQSQSGGGSSTGGPGLVMWIVEPRVGYLLALGEHWIFWPRVGISAFEYSQSQSSGSSTSGSSGGQSVTTSATGFAIDLEPTIALRLLPSAGLTASFLADIGVGGSYSQTGQSTSIGLQSSNYGVTFGAFIGF
jgi:hypothetical protein